METFSSLTAGIKIYASSLYLLINSLNWQVKLIKSSVLKNYTFCKLIRSKSTSSFYFFLNFKLDPKFIPLEGSTSSFTKTPSSSQRKSVINLKLKNRTLMSSKRVCLRCICFKWCTEISNQRIFCSVPLSTRMFSLTLEGLKFWRKH